ncbi:MAG: phosphate--AMP phosphotransferase [bacterium]|nr:MAG: phosphate--AMP phosphotransferase [bacterium]
MLENIDLSQKINKSDYRNRFEQLEIELGNLQRKAKSLQIPIILLFEGWDAAGKGTLINKLTLALEPRGFTVHPINPPNSEEQFRPFLWRFWIKTPEKGRIAIFDRSWYGRVLVERVDRLLKKKVWQNAYHEIKSFERQLVADGAIIIKFFLHISKKEQAKRFNKIQKIPATRWKVTKEDWKHHKQYEKYLEAIEEMLAKTDSDFSPWKIIESHDRRFATVKIFQITIEAIQKRVNEVEASPKSPAKRKRKTVYFDPLGSSVLSKVDLSLHLGRIDYEKALSARQKRLRELEHEIYVKRIPVVLIYAGWDAAGKGGNIRRLVNSLDPRGYEVIPISAPNDIEKAHHYLWRFWIKIPKAGHIAIFDRSWYGRVLVERIEGFCSEAEWRRAYQEINEMEEQLTNFGTILIKFWLHIDKDEQLRRFKEREKIPYKNWKITEEDWRNREKWDQYEAAIDEMLQRTSTLYAPWTIVESNCKWYARIKTLSTVINTIEHRLNHKS